MKNKIFFLILLVSALWLLDSQLNNIFTTIIAIVATVLAILIIIRDIKRR